MVDLDVEGAVGIAGHEIEVEVQAAKLVACYLVAKSLVVAVEVPLQLAGQGVAAQALAAGVALVDQVVAALQSAEMATNADAASINALIAQVSAQTQALVTQAAPVIKAVTASALVVSATSGPASAPLSSN